MLFPLWLEELFIAQLDSSIFLHTLTRMIEKTDELIDMNSKCLDLDTYHDHPPRGMVGEIIRRCTLLPTGLAKERGQRK